MGPWDRDDFAAVVIALLAVLAAAVPMNAEKVSETSVRSADVLVLGAGVAGIVAASALQQKGASVIVIEARNRPYGRVDTVTPAGWPIPIELGAQWLHGSQNNPVFKYASKINVPLVRTGVGDDAVTFDSRGVVADKITDKWDAWFDDFLDNFLPKFRKGKGAAAAGLPLSAAVDAFIAEEEMNAADAAGFLGRIESNFVQEYAASAEHLSLAWFDIDEDPKGPDYIPSRGYQGIFKLMYSVLRNVVLGAEVTQVTWGPREGSGVSVATTKGIFTGKAVVCTFPLGVLQARLTTLFPVKFPALSPGKVSAIKALGMGTLNKVILHFPRPFWTEETGGNQWFDLVPTGDPMVPNEFFSLHKATKEPILVVFYAGQAAVTAEAMTDQQTLDQVMATLRKMFGSDIPAPTRHLITRWTRDKYSLGSYSFMKVGAVTNARSLLAQPEANSQVFFAGEATDDAFPGAVHGAWRSGERVARQVVQELEL